MLLTDRFHKQGKRAPPDPSNKPHRFKPGTVSLREIRRLQKRVLPLLSSLEKNIDLSQDDGVCYP